jgi:PAS domain S-box-containing protein
VGIYILRNGQFLYVNPKLAEIFGYASPEEIVFGKRVLRHRAEAASSPKMNAAGGGKSVLQLRLRKDSGH